MSNGLLDFEKPLIELAAKIEELRKFSEDKGIDLSDEIQTLESKATDLKKTIYGTLTPWQQVQIARHPERPTTVDYIKNLFADFVEMHGDRHFGDDPAVIGGIARFHGQPVTVIGHVKGKDTKENIARNFGYAHPEGYRKALRLMEQAAKFNRPVLTFVDTPGAYCGIGAEERGQAEAIAQNLFRMINLRVPIIATIIGEGGSGGALAIAVGDYVMMLEHAVYSISTPETYASILWKDTSRAAEAAEALKMTSNDLVQLQVIDEVIPEPLGGAQKDVKELYKNIDKCLQKSLAACRKLPVETLLANRYAKFRGIGHYVSG